MLLQNFVSKSFRAVRTGITVAGDFYVGIAAGLLLLPLPWLCSWLLAVTVHESCHYIALCLCGCKVHRICISLKGAIMETDPLPLGKEAFCAYAGPFGALVLLLFCKTMPRTAVCVIVQSLYNLLPVFPLDGGRGLLCLLIKMLGKRWGSWLYLHIETAVLLVLVFVAALAVLRLGLGLLPALAVVLLIIRRKNIKIPCKIRPLGLQ